METTTMTLGARLDVYTDLYLKKMIRRLILGYVMTHKLPWKKEVSETKSYLIIKDAWGKPIITMPDETDIDTVILLAEATLERQRIKFPDGYASILHLWKTIEREDGEIERALRKEDENDFRNMPLIS